MRVLHLTGSPVDEFLGELSRHYGRDCLAATADPAYDAVVGDVAVGGGWRFPTGPEPLSPAALAAADVLPLDAALGRIRALGIDVVVPQMFCRPGMTAYRALFDVLDVPYVGNRPEVMAIGADKPLARAVVGAAGVPVPAAEVVRRGGTASLLPPTVVKPADADNSLGVTLVRDALGYPDALTVAWEHADAALVETFVEAGREVRCGVVERAGELAWLPLEEYPVDADRPVRRAEDKIVRAADGAVTLMAKGPSRAWIVDRDDPISAAVGELAVRCHRALGARHYSLFDFRVDPAGQPWFLEAGLYCSFATQSVIAAMAAADGIPLRTLFAEMITLAVRSGPPRR